MKILAAITVNNEEALIADAILRLDKYVDAFFVRFHNCTDKTEEVVKSLFEPLAANRLQRNITVEDAKSGRPSDFDKFKNAMLELASWQKFDWVLFFDADEIFDPGFFKFLTKAFPAGTTELKTVDGKEIWAMVFPRVNLPGGKDYPDLQVRFVKAGVPVEFRGAIHEKLCLEKSNKTILESDKTLVLEWNPILHLPRGDRPKRQWW